MKGKVTKDILLRVGQGVMRIPREKEENSPQKSTPFQPTSTLIQESDKNSPPNKVDHP